MAKFFISDSNSQGVCYGIMPVFPEMCTPFKHLGSWQNITQ